jgi:hypothetical protein
MGPRGTGMVGSETFTFQLRVWSFLPVIMTAIVSTLDNAAPSGGVGIDNPMGIAQPYAQAWVGTGAIILSDYQLDFLNTIALYYEQ